MINISNIFIAGLLFLMAPRLVAQPCTEALAESRPTVCDRKNDEKRQITYNNAWGTPTAAQVDDGIKRSDQLFPLFKPFLEHTKGFIGRWYPIVHDKTPEGLFYSSFTLDLARAGCKKEGGFTPLRTTGVGINIVTNGLSRLAQISIRKPSEGERNSPTNYLNGSAVYVLDVREPNASFQGYRYFFKNVNQRKHQGVIIVKPGIDFFIPVTVRQFLQIKRQEFVESLADERKKFAKIKAEGTTMPVQTWEENLKSNAEEYERLRVAYAKYPDGPKKYAAEMAEKKAKFEKEQQKLKTFFEDSHQFQETMYGGFIRAIDDFIAATEADFLNKPCITNSSEIAPEDVKKSSFYDQPGGNGHEWVIINPAYLDKKLPPTVPQFFVVWWLWEDYPHTLKGVEAFKQYFDLKKLEGMLGK